MRSVSIVGAGLAGSLMALFLAKRGCKVKLYEYRPDLRITPIESNRSINLALSCRGLTALQDAGLDAKVRQLMVPMRARIIHEISGEIVYQPFGRHEEECINAIERNALNKLLLNELDTYPLVKCYFDTKLVNLNLAEKQLIFQNQKGQFTQHDYDVFIGADGAHSLVRACLQQQKLIDFKQTFFTHGCKELTICRAHQTVFDKESLHLWPRKSFSLLGNPNLDGSITGSLFLPYKGQVSFESLTSEAQLLACFNKYFNDVCGLMPSLIDEFFTHPMGTMSRIDCKPWFIAGQGVLLGDAAHGIIPFFGQGMNSAFEDCRILNTLLDEYDENWQQVLPMFYHLRKPNTDAVAKMSEDNFHEVQEAVCSAQFNNKKRLAQLLMQRYPKRYISKHVLVMFTNTPYSQAQKIGQIQENFLKDIMSDNLDLNTLNWQKVDQMMLDYDKKMADFL